MVLKNKIYVILLISIFMIFAFAIKLEASIEKNANGFWDVNIHYKIDNLDYVPDKVKIYKIAKGENRENLEVLPEFKKYSVKIENAYDTSTAIPLAKTILGLVQKDKIQPYAEISLNERDFLKISNIDSGLYLIDTERKLWQGKVLTYVSSFLSVPDEENGLDDGTINFVVNPKVGILEPSNETIEFDVIIYWKDKGLENERPKDTTIIIYKDDEIYQKVVISEENNWSYSWELPDDGSIWKVVQEDLPSNYQVLTERSSNTFYITNIREKKENSGSNPSGEGSTTDGIKKLPLTGKVVEKLKKLPLTGEEMTIFIFVILAIVSGFGLAIINMTNRNSGEK